MAFSGLQTKPYKPFAFSAFYHPGRKVVVYFFLPASFTLVLFIFVKVSLALFLLIRTSSFLGPFRSCFVFKRRKLSRCKRRRDFFPWNSSRFLLRNKRTGFNERHSSLKVMKDIQKLWEHPVRKPYLTGLRERCLWMRKSSVKKRLLKRRIFATFQLRSLFWKTYPCVRSKKHFVVCIYKTETLNKSNFVPS